MNQIAAIMSNEPRVPVLQTRELPPPSNLIEALLQIAQRPDLDMDRFGQLMEWQEKIEAKQARRSFFEAMSLMQQQLPTINARGEIIITHKDDSTKPHEQRRIIQRTKYARWEDINDALREPLAAHGFALTFSAEREQDRVIITGMLSHRDGHQERTVLPLALDTTGSKNNVQSVGSSIAYGKRYTAGMLLNFTSRAEADRDDDGNGAGAPAYIDGDQLETLKLKLAATKSNIKIFLDLAGASTLEEIPASKYEMLNSKLEAKAKKEHQP